MCVSCYKLHIRKPFQIHSNHIQVSKMVLILDGDSDHVVHAWNKIGLFREKKISYLWHLSIYPNALNRSKNRDCSLRAHIFMSYWGIMVIGRQSSIIFIKFFLFFVIFHQFPVFLSSFSIRFVSPSLPKIDKVLYIYDIQSTYRVTIWPCMVFKSIRSKQRGLPFSFRFFSD